MIQQFDDDIAEDQDFQDKDGEPELEMDTDVEETKRDTPKLESIIEPKKIEEATSAINCIERY